MFTPIGFFAAAAGGPLLDVYPSASFAYSVRKLRSDYTGNPLQMYRQSDGALSDFGFDADGYLDIAGIESWLGSSNGYVQTWYDQSGNGNDLAFGGTRPLIASSGTITKKNGGKASMERVAATGVSTGVTSRGNKTVIVCAQNNENGTSNNAARILSNFSGGGALGTAMMLDFYPPVGVRVFDGGDGATQRNYHPGTVVPVGAAIAGYYKDGTDTYATYNGNTQTSAGGTGNSALSDNYPIYAFEDRGGSNQEYSDGISEIVLWDNQTLDLAGIASNLNDFYGIY